MGFSKKSWLAMVLAIVMVLGMAMPTALAVGDVYPSGKNTLNVADEDGALVVEAIDLDMDSGAIQLDLFADADMKKPLTEKYLGQKAKITVDNADPDVVTVTTGDGFITVTPVGLSYTEAASIVVTVDPTNGDWKSVKDEAGTWNKDAYFEAPLSFNVAPTIAYTGTKVTLDMLNSDKTSYQLTPSKFAAKPVKTIKLDNADDDLEITSTDIEVASIEKSGAYYSIVAKGVGECEVAIKNAKVDNVAAANTVTIKVEVGKAEAGKAYRVGADKSSLSVFADAKAEDLVVNGYLVGPDLVKLPAASQKELNLITATFVPASEKDVKPAGDAVLDGVDGAIAATTAGKIQLAFTDTLVSANGTLVLKKDGVLSAEIPLTIKPMALTATNSVTIDLDKSLAATSTKKVGVLYLSSKDHATTDNPLTIDLDTSFVFEEKAEGLFMVAASADGIVGKYSITVAAGEEPEVGTYKVDVTGTIGTRPTETKTVSIVVSDGTTPPTLTSSKSTVTANIQAGLATPEDAVDVVLTAANTIKWDNYLKEKPEFELDYSFEPELEAGDDAEVTLATLVAVTGNDMAKKLTITGVAKYTGVLKIDGLINGIKLKTPIEISISVVDKTPNQPDHFVVAPNATEVTKKLGDKTYAFTAELVDNPGTKIAGSTGKLNAAIVKDDELDGDVAKINEVDVNGNFTVTFLRAGKATITLTPADTIENAAKATPYVIKLTVTPPTFATNPTKDAGFVLDLKDAASNKVVISVTSADGTVSDITATNSNFAQADAGDPGIHVDSEKNTITIIAADDYDVAANGKRQKLTVKCKVNNADAGEILIPFEVKNSKAMRASKDEFHFELRDGGEYDGVLEITANPDTAKLNITSATSSNESVATIVWQSGEDEVGSWKYLVTGLTNGSGSFTIKGTVGGAAVPDLVIPFTVGEIAEATLKVTPNPLTLGLTGTTTQTMAVVASNNGKVEEAKITYTGDLITVDGLKVTAAKVGAGTFVVDAKIDGVQAPSVSVSFEVKENEAPVVKTQIRIENLTPNADGTYTVPLASSQLGIMRTFAITAFNADGTEAIDGGTWKSTRTKYATVDTKIKLHKNTLTVKAEGTTEIIYTLPVAKATAKAEELKVTIKVVKLASNDQVWPYASPSKMLAGEKKSYAVQILPLGANVKGYKYSLDKAGKKIASVNKYGVVTAKAGKEGKAILTAKPRYKKDNLKTLTMEINISPDWSSAEFYSAYLFDPTATVQDTGMTAVAGLFEKAAYKVDAVKHAPLNLALTADPIKALEDIKGNVKPNDVFALYYSGKSDPATGDLMIGTAKLPLVDLATALSTIDCNVVVYLDSTLSNRFINGKGADFDAQVKAAFSKAKIKSSLVQVPNYRSTTAKIHVITATTTKKYTSTMAEGGTAFTQAFVKALKDTVGNVSMASLYKNLYKTQKVKVGVWPSKYDALVVYSSVTAPAPVVNP